MSDGVASVKFQETGSQQVVTAFKNVGNAAQEGTTKITQNSSAMKNLGAGMKGGISAIGQMTSALATLSLSVVNTWRSYRDLEDAQIAIDAQTKKLHQTELTIANLEKDIAAERKKGKKGTLDYALASNKIQVAEQKLAKDRKEGKKTAAELKGQELEITKMRGELGKGTGTLTEKEEKLKVLREGLAVTQQRLSEAQERYNDGIQNFYLSIIPTALSSIGLLSQAFGAVRSSLVGGGGLIGTLGPLGIALGAISLAVIAFQNNFLGLRDAIGGVIDFFKSRFGDWKKTIEEVFGLIRSGDWGGAFERIKKAAIDFWNDLVNTVPFFGGVNKLVDAIANGHWDMAFSMIKDAALKFWADVKNAIPFFAGAEIFFRQLFAGDFKSAWATLSNGAAEAWAAVVKAFPMLGDIANYLRTKWELASTTAKSLMGALGAELTKKGGAFDQIQQGLAKIGSGDVNGGVGMMIAGIKSGLTTANKVFNDWVKLNFGIDLHLVETQAKDIGMKIMGWIGNSLTFVSTEWIDPFLASIFKSETWQAKGGAMAGDLAKTGQTIIGFISSAIKTQSDPAVNATLAVDLAKTGLNIWNGLSTWMETNLPDTTKALQGIAQSLTDAVGSTINFFKEAGTAIWNGIIQGIQDAVKIVDPTGLVQSALENLKIKPPQVPPIPIPITADTKPAQKKTEEFKSSINRRVPTVKVEGNTNPLMIATNKAIAAINKKQAHVLVQARYKSLGPVPSYSRFAGHQHGTEHITRGPEIFMAGEGGRRERVSVHPIGSASDRGGRAGGGGGGFFFGKVQLVIGDTTFDAYVRRVANGTQGIAK